jgi:transcriptional regulator with XRE-family HTH domain
MDNIPVSLNSVAMKKPLQKRPRPEYVPVFLAEWIEKLNKRPVDLVDAGVISEGYLSLLRNGGRTNPSPGKLKQIGDYLGIDWRDMYRRPPSNEAVDEVEGLGPSTMAAIRHRKAS